MNEKDAYDYNKAINASQSRHEDSHPKDFPVPDWDKESDNDDQGRHMLWRM